MDTSIGSIHAEATLDIEKFKVSAEQMSADADKIAKALDKAGVSLEGIQTQLRGLGTSLSDTQSGVTNIDALSDALNNVREAMTGISNLPAPGAMLESSSQAFANAAQYIEEYHNKLDGLSSGLASLDGLPSIDVVEIPPNISGAVEQVKQLAAAHDTEAVSLEAAQAAVERYKESAGTTAEALSQVVPAVTQAGQAVSEMSTEMQTAADTAGAANEKLGAAAQVDFSAFKTAAASIDGNSLKIASALEKANAALDKAHISVERYKEMLDAASSSMSAAQSVFESNSKTLEEMETQAEAAAIKAAAAENAYMQAQANLESMKAALSSDFGALDAKARLDAAAQEYAQLSTSLSNLKSGLLDSTAGYEAFSNGATESATVVQNLISAQVEEAAAIKNLEIEVAAASEAYAAASAEYASYTDAISTATAITQSAKTEYMDAAAKADALGEAAEKQRIAFDKSAATFKKASSAVNDYKRKISSVESTISSLDGRISGLNQQLTDGALADASEELTGMGDATSTFNAILENLASNTMSRASNSLSTLAVKAAGFNTSSASGVIAARGMSSVMSTLTKSLGGAALGYGALAAAAIYGGYKLYDFASGAKAAREALEDLNEKAKEWSETNVTTSFEKSKGLAGYGIDENSFKPIENSTKDWVSTVTKTWTDGKKETDDIVNATVKGFTDGSDSLRESLTELQAVADRAGVSEAGLFGDLDSDITRLDEIDSAVEKLLKKRQNGFLTDEEIAQLQAYYDEREAIEVKYHLVEDATSGFDEITDNVEAQLSRDADAGTVFADAFTAASQGVQAYTDALNAEYDAQYKVIDLMGEGAEKTLALQQLTQWYTEQATAGTDAYAQALADAASKTGVFDEGGAYAESMEQVTNAAQLMYDTLKNPSNENITALSEALSGLDETQIVEITASLSAMDEAGVNMSEAMTDALNSIMGFKTAAETGVFDDISTELQTALNNMFGEGLDAEVLEIYPSINTEILTSVYNAWAAGEHADIIPSISFEPIDASAIIVNGELAVNGNLAEVDPSTGVLKDATFELDVNGRLLHVDPTTGELTDTGFSFGANGHIVYVDPTTGKITDTGWAFDVPGNMTYVDVANAIANGTIDGLRGTLAVVETDENTKLPEIVVDGVLQFTNVAAPEVKQQYAKAYGEVNEDTPFYIASDTAKTIESLATAVESYNAALASGDTASSSAWLESVQTTAEALGSSLSMNDGEGFQSLAQYIANGLQLLREGALTDEEAAQLTSTIESLKTILGSEIAVSASMSDVGWDLSSGIAEGLIGYGWGTDASTVAKAIEDALREASETNSPSRMTKPIGTDLVDGISQGMLEDTSTSGAADQVAASILAAYQSKVASIYPVGLNFSQGLARGILAGRSSVVSAAINVASAGLKAAKSKLQIASPSKATEEFGEYFDLGFIEGIKNMTPEVMRSVEDALTIDPPAYDMQYGSGTGGNVTQVAIDYDRLADAMNQRQMVMTMDNRTIARVQARETAMAQNARNKRIALGYGK